MFKIILLSISLKKPRVVTTWDSIIHTTLPESIPYMEESKYSTDRRLAEIEIHARKKGEIKENQISCGKWKKIVERISLSLFILVIWGLLLIPVIFYHLPVPQVSM